LIRKYWPEKTFHCLGIKEGNYEENLCFHSNRGIALAILAVCSNPASPTGNSSGGNSPGNTGGGGGGNNQSNSSPITKAETVITAPVKGVEPNTEASGTGNFITGPVSWSPANNPFLGDTVYTASLTLTANNGYTFTGLSDTSINGQSAGVTDNTGTNVSLSYTFPATSAKTVTGMAIKTQPTRLTYTHGDALDLAGLMVTLTYDDGSAEDVAASNITSKNITANPAHGVH
jgi:hypothetical protein